MTGKHSIAGSWRGCYFYSSGNGGGFEAVFIEGANGGIEGNILDDGSLGEALVAGFFRYPAIRFNKVYYKSRHMVQYVGEMSEDGNELSGQWFILQRIVSVDTQTGYRDFSSSGTWTARRSEEGEDLKFDLSEWENLQNEEEEERKRVLTQPGKQR